MDKTVNIIIVNYNCWEDTLECIESIRKTEDSNYRVFVVDNNSTDDSIDVFKSWSENKLNLVLNKSQIGYKIINHYSTLPKQTVFLSSKNISTSIIDDGIKILFIEHNNNGGFATANNEVIQFLLNDKYNENDYIWLLNPDTVIEPSIINDLRQLAEGKERLIIGNIVKPYESPDDKLFFFYGGFRIKKIIHGIVRITKKSDMNKLDGITGTSLFTSLNTFKELGLLPEEYFMYWEEADFCFNAKKNGYHFDVNDSSCIYDRVGTVTNTSYLRHYLYIYNGLKFYKKYYPSRLPFIYLSTLLKIIKVSFSKDTKKRRAILRANFDFFLYILGVKINVKNVA